MLHGSLYSLALCLGPNLALTFGPDFGPHLLPLAPNLYLLTKAPNFYVLVFDPRFVFRGLDPLFVFTNSGPKFLFAGPGQQFYYQSVPWLCIYRPCLFNLYLYLRSWPTICIIGLGPEFAFTLLLVVVVVVAVVVVIVVVISLE